jgi:hypothetical protein
MTMTPRRLAGCAFCISFCLPALAQQNLMLPAPEQQVNGFSFGSPLVLSGGQDKGFIAGGKQLDDTTSVLTAPALAFMSNSARTHLSIQYQPEFEMFSEHPNLNAWNHSAMFRFDHGITPRLTFEAGDLFLSTNDPIRSLPNSLLMLQRGRFAQNSAYAGFSYRLDPGTTVGFHVNNVVLVTASPDPARPSFLDEMSTAWTALVQRALTRRHAIAGSYSYLRFRPLGSQVDFQGSQLAPRPAMHNAALSYTYTPADAWVFQVTAGAIRSQQLAYTAGAQIERRIGRVWAVASYDRYLAFAGGFQPLGGVAPGTVQLANGVLPSSLYQVASLSFRGRLSRRVAIDVSGIRNLGQVSGQRVQTVIGRSRLEYRLTDRVIPFVSFEVYHQNLFPLLNFPLNRKRYSGGLQIILSRAAAIEAARAAAAPPAGLRRSEEQPVEPGAGRSGEAGQERQEEP